MNIQRVIGYQHKHSFAQFKKFLQTLEAYGTGYNDDVGPQNYKIRENESHWQTARKQIEGIIRMYEVALLQVASDRFTISNERDAKVSTGVLQD